MLWSAKQVLKNKVKYKEKTYFRMQLLYNSKIVHKENTNTNALKSDKKF